MSVAGQWNVEMETPIGKQTFVWTLQSAESGWTGSMESRAGKSEITNIQVDDDAFALESAVNSPMGTIELSFAGNVSGDSLSGTCGTMFGSQAFSGTRA